MSGIQRSILILVAVLAAVAAWLLLRNPETEPDEITEEVEAETRAELPQPSAPSVRAPSFGRARVSGQVLDPDGHAVADAQVCGLRRPLRLPVPERACARTDAEGSYSLELSAGAWRFGASAPGWAPTNAGPRRSSGDLSLGDGDEERLDFVLLEPGEIVRGVVLDALGGPVSGATVTLGSHPSLPRPGAYTKSDDEGRFAITTDPRIAMLTAYASGYAPATASVGGGAELVELVMLPETLARGVVVWDATGGPIANVRVKARRSSASTYTDAKGRFSLAVDARRGDTLLARAEGVFGELELPAGSPGESREVELRVGASVDLELTLTVEGQPCEDGYVQASADGRTRDLIEIHGEPVVLAGLPTGQLELELGCRGAILDRRFVGLSTAGKQELSVDLELTGALRGHVLDSQGEPLARVWVHARGPVNLSQLSGPSGDFTFDVLPPGDYELDARDPRSGRGGGPVTVELGRENIERELTLGPLPSVSGSLSTPDGEPAKKVALSLAELGTRRGLGFTTTDAEGHFEFPAIFPGRYGLYAGGLRLAERGSELDADHVELELDDEALELALVTEARELELEVHVVDGDGRPAPGIEVRAARAGEEIGSALVLQLGRKLSNIDGELRFGDLPEGTITLEVPGNTVEVDASAGVVELSCGDAC